MEKTLMMGKVEGRRRKRQQRMRLLDGITDSMDMNQRKLQEIVEENDDEEKFQPSTVEHDMKIVTRIKIRSAVHGIESDAC